MNFKSFIINVIIFLSIIPNIVFANFDDYEPINIEEINAEIISTNANASEDPKINSKSAIVLERSTKSILFSKEENQVRKMASTTKIMTAIVVIENANLYDTVTISKKAATTGGSRLGIKEGDKITICDLLYGLLLKSGNDTAVALAETVGGSIEGFAEMMNKKAQDLGLENTNFVTPHGLDSDNHYTTAYELAILTDYALNNQTFFNFVSTKNYTVTINGIPKSINNTNELLGNLNGVYGVKTGFTNGANRCLVTACKRDNLDIICIVLGADTKKFRTQDSIKLIEYTYKKYKMVNLKEIVDLSFAEWKNNNIQNFNINKSTKNTIDLKIKDFNYNLYPIKKEEIDSIKTQIQCNYDLTAPIKSGTNIGTLQIVINNVPVLKYAIVNTNNIDRKNCFIYYQEILTNFFNYLTTSH